MNVGIEIVPPHPEPQELLPHGEGGGGAMSLCPAHAEAASAVRTAPRRRPRNCSVLRQHARRPPSCPPA